MHLKLRIKSLVVAWAIGLAACSVALLPEEAQCETDADCSAQGFALSTCNDRICVPVAGCDEDSDCADRGIKGASCEQKECVADSAWACLGTLEDPVAKPGQTVRYQLKILEILSQNPPANLRVMVCNILDVDCKTPVAGPLPVRADGTIQAELDSGFEGFLDVTTSNTLPALIFLGPPLVTDLIDGDPILLLTADALANNARVAGFTLDPSRGHMLLTTTDCDRQIADGIRVDVEAGVGSGQRFYVIDNQPDPDASETDSSGNAGFINLQAQFHTVIGTRQATDEYVGKTRFQVRPGTVSYITVVPTP